ncbi:uncharacterized protein Dvir_GJ26394, isoform B [Drosophila virilis]|uniref:Uncharacterized protein, isoform B n=1 Tax=Drosophila virilis TaxID=7244 RepID=A0A0Q9WVH6_DROVI|nr:uncharacterized protein Dvir_GJ26394, isoform B [Drosophila virilis]
MFYHNIIIAYARVSQLSCFKMLENLGLLITTGICFIIYLMFKYFMEERNKLLVDLENARTAELLMKDEIKDIKIKACEEKINVLEDKVSTLNKQVKYNKEQLKNSKEERSCPIS